MSIASTVHEAFAADGRNISAAAVAAPFPTEGWVRLRRIIGDDSADPPIPPFIEVSKSTWWDGCRTGRFPAAQYPFGKGVPFWDASEIRRCAAAAGQAPERTSGRRLVEARARRRGA